jgi:hypothetical protein
LWLRWRQVNLFVERKTLGIVGVDFDAYFAAQPVRAQHASDSQKQRLRRGQALI